MTDPLRHVELTVPDGWRTLAAPPDASAARSLARQDLRTASEWAGEHRDDGSQLAVWSVRADVTTMDRLIRALRRQAGAELVDGRWVWAHHAPDRLSVCVLQPADEVEGPALLWASHLPLATAAARLREILAVVPRATWRWKGGGARGSQP